MTPRAMERGQAGCEIVMGRAGSAAGFPDSEFQQKGARIASGAQRFSPNRNDSQVGRQARIRTPGARFASLRSGQVLIGFAALERSREFWAGEARGHQFRHGADP